MSKKWKVFLLIAIAFTSVQVAHAASCEPPGPDQAVIYQHTDQGGKCRVLGVGNYPSSSSFSPVPNDAASSLDVGANVRVVLYQHTDFGGLQAHHDGGWIYDNLGKFNDRTSSIEVFPMQGGPAATWYLGDYPYARENFWSNDSQGIANDGANWFLTKGYNADNTRLFKIPLWYDLNSGSEGANLSTGIPPALSNVGYNHFGDLDQSSGFLFVPLEHPSASSKPLIAVFSAVDLRFLSAFELSDNPDRGASWLAIRPGERTLWVSSSDLREDNQLREYDIDWDRLTATGQLMLTFRRQVTLRDRDGVTMNLASMQGGVFNPEGTLLYTSNGSCSSHGYVHVFAIEDATDAGLLQARSENGYGPFNFETHPEMVCFFGECVCGRDEAEGIDFLDVRGLGVPGISDGQLHVIMIDNDLTEDDNLYLKHYSF